MPPEQELRFGTAAPAGETKVVLDDPNQKLPWFRIMEQAWIQYVDDEQKKAYYGDPRGSGATLSQAWRSQFAVSGMFFVCLVSSERLNVSTEGIPTTVAMTPSALVQALVRILSGAGRHAAVTFVHDGAMGHAITPFGADPKAETITYHDPWPGDSLLTRANNAAGVDAQRVDERNWRVTAEELQRVVVASFVFSTDWADLTGVEYRVSGDEVVTSEFWRFFHMREPDRQSDDGRTILRTKPGGDFSELVDLEFAVEDGRVREATLALDRAFVTGEPWGVSPFALDITSSFLRTFVPAPDLGDLSGFSLELITKAAEPGALQIISEEQPALSQLLEAYVGAAPETTILMPFSRIVAANVEQAARQRLVIRLDLY